MMKHDYIEEHKGYVLGFDMELVVDWEDRIRSYSPEIKQIYYTAFEKIKRADELFIDKTLDWVV